MIPGLISENFSWYEVQHSDTAERLGIDNSLPSNLQLAAIYTAKQMERVRAILQAPIHVNSWYRGPELQKLPNFKNPKSAHPKATAVDFVSPQFGIPFGICKQILKYPELIKFNQLILEHSWVHIEFCFDPGMKPKGEVLSLLKSGGYADGLTDLEGKPL